MKHWTKTSYFALVVVLVEVIKVEGQKKNTRSLMLFDASKDSFVAGSESIRIEEIKYLWLHLQQWRAKRETTDGRSVPQYVDSMHPNESSPQPEKLQDLIVEFTSKFNLCYNCVGIITVSGMRYGCTDTITEMDFSHAVSSNSSADDLIVPCVGDCMLSRYFIQGSSTFVRSCNPDRCTEHRNAEKCSHWDGACVKCCNSKFCNREYPLSFLLQDPSDSGAGMPTTTISAILILLFVYSYFDTCV